LNLLNLKNNVQNNLLLEIICKQNFDDKPIFPGNGNIWSSKVSHAPISHMSASMCWTVPWAQAPEETVGFHAVLNPMGSFWRASSIHIGCEDQASSQRACYVKMLSDKLELISILDGNLFWVQQHLLLSIWGYHFFW